MAHDYDTWRTASAPDGVEIDDWEYADSDNIDAFVISYTEPHFQWPDCSQGEFIEMLRDENTKLGQAYEQFLIDRKTKDTK
jgi:hypothetical protein